MEENKTKKTGTKKATTKKSTTATKKKVAPAKTEVKKEEVKTTVKTKKGTAKTKSTTDSKKASAKVKTEPAKKKVSKEAKTTKVTKKAPAKKQTSKVVKKKVEPKKYSKVKHSQKIIKRNFKKRVKVKNVIMDILMVVILIMIICGTVKFVTKTVTEKKEADTIYEMNEVIEKIEEDIKVPEEKEDDKKVEKVDVDSLTISALKKYYGNKDIVARLQIDGLNINTVITKAKDNDFYLDHNVYGNSSILGNSFVDYRNDLKSDKQINIYGHNSLVYDLPFVKLTNYLHKDFYKENKYIKVQTEYGTKTYQVFSIYGAKEKDNTHMQMSFETNDEWQTHFRELKAKSVYDTYVSVKGTDNVLVLQTCIMKGTSYTRYGKYLVIVAKEVRI